MKALLIPLGLLGCVTPVAVHCPACAIVDRAHPVLPQLKAGTNRLFVIVPGALGFGWEWNGAVKALSLARGVDFVVFGWDPWHSFQRATDDFTEVLMSVLLSAPPQITDIVVVAHSAAGLFCARSLDRLKVPRSRHLTLATIGAPFAGMMGPPGSLDDPWRSPALIAIMGTFRSYPRPPKGVEVIEYVTSYPEDPVMQPRYGHLAAPADIGPPGRKRVILAHADHNKVVGTVVEELLTRERH